MDRNSLVFGLLVLGVAAGVLMVVLSEAVEGLSVLLPVGGVVGLLSIGGLTAAVLSVDAPESESESAEAGH